MSESRIGAAIVAAGSGSRFGKPKQFALLGGKPLLLWSVETFVRSGLFQEVVLVVAPEKESEAREILDAAKLDHIVVVSGGVTRQQSVLHALNHFDHEGQVTHVLVHDAARALIGTGIIQRAVESLAQEEAVLVALPVVDTLKYSNENHVERTVSREGLWRAQTPQGGQLEPLLSASRAAEAEGYTATDECELMERIGIRPIIIPGSERNFKITYPEDLEWAEQLLR
jgi:2-C-methyl-D-erythritol 4-phosphate cytidylyltransferase